MTSFEHDPRLPVSYQIRVRGRLGKLTLRAFPALRAQAQGGDTLLTGPLADQSALHGVLHQIEALSLELLEVRRLPGPPRPLNDARESPSGLTRAHPAAPEAWCRTRQALRSLPSERTLL